MASKQPTPQAISALLRRAGWMRSLATPRRKGSGFSSARSWSEGYQVRGLGAEVGVWHICESGSGGNWRGRQADMLSHYADSLRAAGYRASISADGDVSWLMVAAEVS